MDESKVQQTRSSHEPLDDFVIQKTTVIPLGVGECFSLWTESRHLANWLCAKARVDQHPGGRYELFWDPSDDLVDSTIGCRITVLVPGKVLGFQWRSPRQFKAFANVADPLTHVVVSFHGDDKGKNTHVTLVHSGWPSSPQWLEAAQWQDRAWDFALESLLAHARPRVE